MSGTSRAQGFLACDQLRQRFGAKLGDRFREQGVVHVEDGVRAAQSLRQLLDAGAGQDGGQRNAQPVSDFSSQRQRFISDFGELSSPLLGHYPNVSGHDVRLLS